MNTNKLTEALKNYGSDIDIIRGRFMEDMGFYASCLEMFLEDKNLEFIGNAIRNGDYKEAFEAAHAFKGLCGNMELPSLYDVVCALVESLRTGKLDDIDIRYEIIVREYNNVRSMVSLCT